MPGCDLAVSMQNEAETRRSRTRAYAREGASKPPLSQALAWVPRIHASIPTGSTTHRPPAFQAQPPGSP